MSKLFEPCREWRLGSYGMKHTWEVHTGEYISEGDFQSLMIRMGYKQKPGAVCLYKLKRKTTNGIPRNWLL